MLIASYSILGFGSVGLSVSSMPSVNTRLREATPTAARYMWWAATLLSNCECGGTRIDEECTTESSVSRYSLQTVIQDRG